MIWRAEYVTPYLEKVVLPVPTGESLEGVPFDMNRLHTWTFGFDLRSLVEQERWNRLLLAGGLPDVRSAQSVVLPHPWDETMRATLAEITPRSRHGRTFALTEAEGALADLVEPDRPGRAYAAVLRRNIALVLFMGPPTEGAWEHFEATIRSALQTGEGDETG